MLKRTHEIERSNLNCFGMLCSLDASESNSWEGGKRARGRGGGRAAEERGFSTQISVLIVGGTQEDGDGGVFRVSLCIAPPQRETLKG